MASYRPPPRGINAHYAIAAVAITVLINRRKDVKLIPGLLQQNGGKTKKVRARHLICMCKGDVEPVGLGAPLGVY